MNSLGPITRGRKEGATGQKRAHALVQCTPWERIKHEDAPPGCCQAPQTSAQRTSRLSTHLGKSKPQNAFQISKRAQCEMHNTKEQARVASPAYAMQADNNRNCAGQGQWPSRAKQPEGSPTHPMRYSIPTFRLRLAKKIQSPSIPSATFVLAAIIAKCGSRMKNETGIVQLK